MVARVGHMFDCVDLAGEWLVSNIVYQFFATFAEQKHMFQSHKLRDRLEEGPCILAVGSAKQTLHKFKTFFR